MTATLTPGHTRRHIPGLIGRAAIATRDTALGYWKWLRTEVDSRAGTRIATRSSQRHALIVVAGLPPRFGSGVFRPHSWLRYAGDNGWRVSAVTRALDAPPNAAGRELAATIPDDVTICHAEPMALKPSYKLFARVDGGLLNALSMYAAGVRAFADDPPSVVVGTAPSFNDFIAAFFLARRFGARLVLDYRDEWTQNPFPVVTAGRLDRWWEARCLKAADAVLFTTASQLHHTGHIFHGLIGDKGSVLTNGWDPASAAPDDDDVQGRDDDRLEITFSGILGAMALPGPFLRDCAAAIRENPRLRDKLRLRFIGSRRPAAERDLEKFEYPEALDLVGEMPKGKADRMARQSDTLLLMSTPDMARYMPGKMFEYMASGKPILVHGHSGEVSDLVLRFNAGLYVAEGDSQSLAQALDTLEKTPPEVWDNHRRRDWAEGHTRRNLSQPFFTLLSKLVADDGRQHR